MKGDSTAPERAAFSEKLDSAKFLGGSLLTGPIDPRYRRSVRLAILWGRRKSLFTAGIWGATLAALAAFLSPVRFTSTARLMPPDGPSWRQFAALSVLGSLIGSASPGKDTLDEEYTSLARRDGLFAGLLSSDTVRNSVIQKFDLRGVYGSPTWADARKQLSRRTNILLDRKNSILTIQVTDHQRQRAVAIVREYISQLNKVIIDLNTSSAHREHVFLEQELTQISSELESAEKNLSQFSSGNSAIDLDAQSKTKIEARAILEGQLIARQAELAALRRVYADDNIRVQISRSRIDEFQRQIRKLVGYPNVAALAVFSGPEPDLSLRTVPLLRTRYADLYRLVKIDEVVFEAFTRDCEAAKVQEAKEVPSVTVLDAPEFPEEKTFPQRILMTAVGFCLGVLLCVVGLLVRADWDHLPRQDPAKVLAGDVYRAIRNGLLPSRG